MNIGRLRDLVSLFHVTAVKDDDGGYTEPETPLSPPTMKAEIMTASVRDMERIQAGTVISTDSLIVRMRFHPGVTTETKLRWTDQAGRVRSANVTGVHQVDGRTHEMQLVVVES